METYSVRSRFDRVKLGAAAIVATTMCMQSAAFAADRFSDTHATVSPAEDVAEKSQSFDWERQWRDSFSGNTLHDRWEIIDHTANDYPKYQQYRDFNVKVKKDKLVIFTRRHCVQPGEDMTLSNAQVEPCADGMDTQYSSGRVQQHTPDIHGNFRVRVKARMPEGMEGRASIWMNNIDTTPGSLNDGYCVEGSTTPTAEIDLQESLADTAVRGAHHVYCENGTLDKVTRKKSFPKGWLKKVHTYEVVREGKKTILLVDGTPVPVSGTKRKQHADRPRDFTNTSANEFDEAYAYHLGMIMDTETFTDSRAASPLFRAPDPDKNFPVQQMKIEHILVQTAN